MVTQRLVLQPIYVSEFGSNDFFISVGPTDDFMYPNSGTMLYYGWWG